MKTWLIGLFVCAALTAQLSGQERRQATPYEAFGKGTSDWTAFRADPGAHLVVIEARHPGRRQVCKVRARTADAISCSRRLGPDRVISRKDVLAVVDPRNHSGEHFFFACVGTSLAIIAGGFFAGPAAPAVWVLGGVALYFSAAAAMAVDGDRDHDVLLYQSPDPIPPLPLR